MIETMQDFYDEWSHNDILCISIITDDETNEITHIYMEDDILYYSIVAPHSGNNFKYMLRINPIKTFDRWSVADIEEFYDTIDRLDYALKNNEWLYSTLLNIYIDRYAEDLYLD